MVGKSLFLLSLLQGVLPSEWTMRALPHRAISKSCVVIPCSFDFPSNPYQSIHGAWFKYWFYWKYTVCYTKNPDYRMSEFKGRAKIVGNLSARDCSLRIDNLRRSDSDVYYFYVELEGFDSYTYKPPVQLQVLEVPDKPEILLPDTLTEGTRVNIVCKALYTCPEHRPSLTWSELANSTVNELGEQTSREISNVLTFTPSFDHHGQTIRCTVDYFETSHRLESSIVLNVRYPPKETMVRMTLRGISAISLSCSSEANPSAIEFSWFKVSGTEEETDLGLDNETITVDLATGKQAVSYYCRATNIIGSSRSPSVQIPKQHEAIILRSSNCTRYPTNVTCFCMIQSIFPVNTTWGLLGQMLETKGAHTGSLVTKTLNVHWENLMEDDNERQSSLVTSTLTIHGVNQTLGTVNCLVANPHGLPPSEMELKVLVDSSQGNDLRSSQKIPIIPLAAVGGVVLFIILFTVGVIVKQRRRPYKASLEAKGGLEMASGKENKKDKKCGPKYFQQTAKHQEGVFEDPDTRSSQHQTKYTDIYENTAMEDSELYANL
ncbi:sialic acid-binding Ig-like lectin 14 [Hemitrygon akajei]|uniref:sialic acid-binding Ig-like lectin 14 n=1 Tax=Hemitrygon akajei TaxID=2704970 RepID=UPI003BF997E7